MLSGSDALKSIDNAIAGIRADEQAMASRVRETTDTIARLRAQQAAGFARLAELRLDSIRQGEFGERLTQAERRAATLIAGHTSDLDAIEERIAAGEAERQRLTGQREAAASAAEEAESAYDSELATFQQAFRKTKAYKDALAETEAAEAVLLEAERKAQIAADDRTEKGEPYEADPLFMYLWERKFGTRDYKTGALTRMLDRWVAGIVGYMDAAANYRMLLEIPKRLNEHVNALRKRLDETRDALKQAEETAREKSEMAAVEKAMDEAHEKLKLMDEAIAAESARRSALEAERAKLVRGDDGPYREAVELLGFELSRKDLQALLREAALTATPEDDQVVQEIEETRQDANELERDLDRQRAGLAELDQRREELEALRQRYVSSSYDDAGSYFENDNMLRDLLIGIAQGVLSSRGVWRQIERAHKRTRKADTDFGWRQFPSPRSGGPILRRPSGGGVFGGGSRRGGFGGGRGGGGFRTGGGF
ncbi:hypothetical protein ACKTEK_04255 [Tepidamorphus sp. 3E244]|uniref:hypothetical protein n=1 Tax=Tepidamorphus sp. 3E244 TaxID=3385498 RepID=UPI0038FCF3E3